MAAKFFNKRVQAATEALNKNVEKTEMDPDFQMLANQTDATKNTVEKLLKQIPTFLHPNPAARAKLGVSSTYAKMTKSAAEKRYPHTTGEIAETMLKGGSELTQDGESAFGEALLKTGEVLNNMCEAQHQLDAGVGQNFLEPLRQLMEKDIKEIGKHRKKLDGRRLDMDYKRRKQATSAKITESDIKIAESKFEESRGLSESAMANLLDNDAEQVAELNSFVQSLHEYHMQCADMLAQLAQDLEETASSASSRPRREYKAPVAQYDDDDDDEYDAPSSSGGDSGGPSAKALFDFDAENEGEINFREGQVIKLISRLDDNWLEGECNGEQGIFPSNYVEILVDL